MEESSKSQILSIRIVSVDHYMCYPVTNVDLCYSDFRGTAIKQVPVIRIFGSTTNGEKLCANVHGVFPYLYVPCSETNPDTINQLSYQIANSVDKAINISLGQTNSTTQHVFKVSLVKGIPYYGYHKNEHQFFKVYLYNPNMIRRVSNLFQNALILDKILQPHESHIPYILKFFIDYNLYGMSWLHVPKQNVTFRNEDAKSKKRAVSAFEIDFNAINILNRLLVNIGDSKKAANPGIESIWEDERTRRKVLNIEDPVDPSASQARTDIVVTDSDKYYKGLLASKLAQFASNETMNLTNNLTLSNESSKISETKKKFNLKALIENADYPAEFCESSFPSSPVSVKITQNSNESLSQKEIEDMEQQFLNYTQTLSEEDEGVLEVMKLLDENENREVENDSLLAPMTQRENVLSQVSGAVDEDILEKINKTIVAENEVPEFEEDSDDELFDQLNFTIPELEVFSQFHRKPEQESDLNFKDQILQLDGSNDIPENQRKYSLRSKGKVDETKERLILKASQDNETNKKIVKQLEKPKSSSSPSKNVKDSDKEQSLTPTPRKSVRKTIENPFSRKTQKISQDNKVVKNVAKQLEDNKNSKLTSSPSDVARNYDKEHGFIPIPGTSGLKIREPPPSPIPSSVKKFISSSPSIDLFASSSPSEKSSNISILDSEEVQSNLMKIVHSIAEKRKNDLKKDDDFEDLEDTKIHSFYENTFIDDFSGSGSASSDSSFEFLNKKAEKRGRTPDLIDSDDEIEILEEEKKSNSPKEFQHAQKFEFSDELKVQQIFVPEREKAVPKISPDSEDVKKFEENSVILVPKDIPLIDLVSSDSIVDTIIKQEPNETVIIVITPQLKPPDPETAEEDAKKYVDNPIPHYGDPVDVTEKKEIGHLVLQLPGNKLNDLEGFESLIFQENCLNKFQKNQLRKNFSVADNHFKSTQQVKEFLASEKTVVIRPFADPPTQQDAINWLKAYEIYKEQSNKTNFESDSPIKVRREKILMCLDEAAAPKEDLNESVHTPENKTQKIIRYSEKSDQEIPSSQEKYKEESGGLRNRSFSYSARRKNFKLKMSFKRRFNSIMKDRIRDELSKSVVTQRNSEEIENSQESSRSGSGSPVLEVLRRNIKRNKSARSPNEAAGKETPKSSKETARRVSPNLFSSASPGTSNETVKQEMPKVEVSPFQNQRSPGLVSSASPNLSMSNSQSNDSIQRLLNQSTFIRNANNLDETNFYNSCEISAATLDNTCGFKMKLESLKATKSSTEYNFLTIFSVEVHVVTRKEMRPDPELDEISAVFYAIENDVPPDHSTPASVKGIILHNTGFNLKYIKGNVDIHLVNNERELFDVFLDLVRKFDPDIFAGYEIEMGSWGYIIQRGYQLGMNLMNKLSRVPSDKERPVKSDSFPMKEEDDPGDRGDYYSEMKIPGRILLDVWRLLRHEIALTSYSFENTMYHILHRRYPKHSFSHLTEIWKQSQTLWIVLDYYVDRAKGTVELLKQLDLIGRTCELAKLFGIQFYEVLSRGSQFRVESMMLRIAKPRNFVPVTPSVQQRAHMRAPEYLPLILEPQSRFYSDPVIVLDFQSLYPSMIIAYNYCFSTCLGRVEFLGQSNQPFEFGVSHLKVPPKVLEQQFLEKDQMTVSPCGVAFVKSSVREGVLPRMLKEILDTRLMVKSSMKIHKNDSALQRVFHSRQLGLKLIANVTYGYTAANFSGRMPCIEVGDSVVSKGRETLERAIKMVEENEEWGCQVVYGDTDSLFVLVPGRTRQEAFKIGEQIAKKVTNENPPPVKLKLEKVYQPCILQTKKRYVGYMYESADQKEPVYEAKGIETVRRDGCPAVAKMLEKSLRILFETCDVSKVKDYVLRQFTKILTGRANLQDLIFAKEFRGINGYKPRACVPSLMLTRKWKLSDPRAEPRRGERVPFVIVNGAPGLPLIRLVRTPLEVLKDNNYKINAIYYITKMIIPALNRCFLLIGANVNDWFAELPRNQQFIPMLIKSGGESFGDKKKSTISQYFSTTNCAADCGQQCKNETGICDDCRSQPQKTVALLSEKIFHLERKAFSVQKICDSCCRRSYETDCISLDCPVLYVLNRVKNDHKQADFYRQIIDKF